MTKLLVSTKFHSHPAVMLASMEAIGMWTRCGSWSAKHTTDGRIPRAVAHSLGTESGAQELVKAGLWRRVKGAYQMVREVPAARGCKPIELWRIRRDDQRDHIPVEIRRAVMARDRHACVDCGAVDDLTLDHIHPWSLGGPDTVENLRVLCRPCNSRKGARI